MSILSVARRRDGQRLVVTVMGTLTASDVARLLPHGAWAGAVQRLDLQLGAIRFDMAALVALAWLMAEAPVPVHISPDEMRLAVEAAAGTAFADELGCAAVHGQAIACCAVDCLGRLRFANGEARELLGLSDTDAPTWETIRPRGRDPVAEALAGGRPVQLDNPAGGRIHAVALPGGGAIVGFIPPAGNSGGPDRRQTAAVQMAAAAAHEIRNPLAAIRAGVQVLQGKLTDTPHIETLAIVLSEIDRLARLLDHYLAINRPSVRRTMQLAQSVDSCLLLLRQDPRCDNVTVRVRRTASLPPILGDPEMLRQVLWNVLSNALEAMDGRGELAVELSHDPALREVTIVVSDSGPGFPAEILASPLEVFRTTKPHGTGLGLVISHEIVLAHGGRMRLSNDGPGGGAMIRISLPQLA